MNLAIQLVILVGVRTCPSQLRLVELRQSLRAGGVGEAEDVVLPHHNSTCSASACCRESCTSMAA